MKASYKNTMLPLFAHWGGYDMRKALLHADLAREVMNEVEEEIEEMFGDDGDEHEEESVSTDDSKRQPFTNFIQGNSEGVRSFVYGRVVRFQDFAEHLKESLGDLAKGVDMKVHAPDMLKWIRSKHGLSEEQALSIAKGKAFFPHGWLNSATILDETTEFPDKHSCWSSTQHKALMHAEHKECKRVFSLIGAKSMRDYHDFYLSVDVFVLMSIMRQHLSALWVLNLNSQIVF